MGIISLFERVKKKLVKRNVFLGHLPKNSVGAELGVFLADFSLDILNIVDPNKVYLVDPYYKSFEYYGTWANVYNDGHKLSTKEAANIAQNKINQFKNAELIIRDDLDFLQDLEDDSLDWVYIDSSHEYEHTKRELELCRLKVKKGGIIGGHDYNNDPNHRHYGVTQALFEFCQKYRLVIDDVDVHTQWILYNEK